MEHPGNNPAEPHELNERVFRNATSFRVFLAVFTGLICLTGFSFICFFTPGEAINVWLPLSFLVPFLATRYVAYRYGLKKQAQTEHRTVSEIAAFAKQYGENEPDYRKLRHWLLPGILLLITVAAFFHAVRRDHKFRKNARLTIGTVTGFQYRKGTTSASISYVVGQKKYETKSAVGYDSYGGYVFPNSLLSLKKGDQVYLLYIADEPEITELVPEGKVVLP